MRKIKMLSICISLSTAMLLLLLHPWYAANLNKISTPPVLKTEQSAGKSITPTEKISNKAYRKQSKVQTDLYEYLMNLNNRESVKEIAIKLNNGHQRNSCVYFVSEALRRVAYDVPLKVCYTGNYRHADKEDISLICYLRKMGWKESKDLSLLLPGDICFTGPNSEGYSTHSYIFMGWVEKGTLDSAYVCDNQSYDYGVTLHIRNIKNALKDKSPLYFFMYLDNYGN